MDPVKSPGDSVALLIEQVTGDLLRRSAPAISSESEQEVRQALWEGVGDLRQRGVPEQEIRDYLVRTFYTVRERLFSSSETRPSLFWTVFEYIGGLPILLVVLVWLFPAGHSLSGRLGGHVAQLVATALMAMYVFLSQLDVSGGCLHKRRLLFLRKRLQLSEIVHLRFERTHLFGKRRVILNSRHDKIKLESRIRGFDSTAFLLSFLPGDVCPPEVRRHLREAWLKRPMETARFTAAAPSTLVLVNLVWYWKWDDIWAGNGITWYSLVCLILSFVTLVLMGARVTGSARIGVLRFVSTCWVSISLLLTGLLIGPVHATRMSLYPLSLCVSVPLLVLFCRERVSLVVAFACLSVLAGYQMMAVYRSVDDGLLFATHACFPVELKQKSNGYAWISTEQVTDECFVEQTSGSQVIKTRLSADAWCLVPSKQDELFVGVARTGASAPSGVLGKIHDDGQLEVLSTIRWTPLKGNSELIWSPDNSHLVLPVFGTGEERSRAKVVAANLRDGDQNDFQGLGSCNIVQWLDTHRFEAVWFDPGKLAKPSSGRELKLIRYDVRTSEVEVLKTVTLKGDEPVSAQHLPRSACVLIQSPDGSLTEQMSIVDLADGAQHDLGPAEHFGAYSWNSGRRLFAWVGADKGGIRLKVLDLSTGKILEKGYPSRTRFAQLSLSPDGMKLFYLSYCPGLPYVFARMIKGDVWDFSSGKTQSVYCPGSVEGILMAIATYNLSELSLIQWTPDSAAVIAPDLAISTADMKPGQKFYRRPLSK